MMAEAVGSSKMVQLMTYQESDDGGGGFINDDSADDTPVISSDSDIEAETYVSDHQQAETVEFLSNWAIKSQVTVDGLT